MGAHATAAAPAELKASKLLEEQIRSKTQIMIELTSKGDFVGVAAALAEVDVLTKSRSATPTVMPPLPSSASGTTLVIRDLDVATHSAVLCRAQILRILRIS